VNPLCELFFGSCLCLVPIRRVRARDGRTQARLRHCASGTMFCFTLGGPT
jgi:hypothetical protein